MASPGRDGRLIEAYRWRGLRETRCSSPRAR
jgi:hypothetical protein